VVYILQEAPLLIRFGINYFLFFSSIAIVAPYLQVILRNKGFTAAAIGIFLGFYEVAGILGPLFYGWIAEKIGRYRLLMLGLSVSVGGILFLLGLSSSLICAGAFLALFGFFYRPIPSLQDALASRMIPDPAVNYGRVRIWGSIGFVVVSIGVQLSGFLDIPGTFKIILLFSIISGLLFLSTLSLPETEKAEHQESKTGKRETDSLFYGLHLPFYAVLISAFFIKMGLTGYYSFFSLFLLDSYGIHSVSGIWAIGALAEIPMILYGSKLVTRFGSAAALMLALAGAAARMFVYASGAPLLIILSAQILHAFSFGLIHITVVSVINHTVPAERKAFAMSLYGGIGFGLAGFIGSSLNGMILDSRGFSVMFLFSGLVTLIPLAVVIPFRRKIADSSFNSKKAQ